MSVCARTPFLLTRLDYLDVGPWSSPDNDYLARVLVEEMEAASTNTRRLLDEGKTLAESQFLLVVGSFSEGSEGDVHPRVVQAFK